VKRDAYLKLRAKGLEMAEGRFFERARVQRFLDGGVRVGVVDP
jgi:hypothetical protein